MSKFIKLHPLSGGEILINTDSITSVEQPKKGEKEVTTVYLWGYGLSGATVDTKETFEEIEEMLMH